MRTIIAGSRSITNYKIVKEILDQYKSTITRVISGTARGIDTLGERWALENKIDLSFFPANWDRYGKKAGFMRNKEMADYAEQCIVIWDDRSRGSNHMISIAKEKGLRLYIHVIS